MMYLGLALYAEGPTDHDFLGPLIYRLCEDLVHAHADQDVTVSDVTSLNELARPRRRSIDRTGLLMPTGSYPEETIRARDERVLAAARLAKGQWTVLFVHADGAGDPDRVRREQVQPALDLVSEDDQLPGAVCAVIPVREMESWALADFEALGVKAEILVVDDTRVPPVRPAQVERIEDPKKGLIAVMKARRQGRAGRSADTGDLYRSIGQNISLSRLRDVPSFVIFETELRDRLRELRILSR